MRLDESWLLAFLLVFARISAMLLSSPVFGGTTPTQVRVGICGAVSFALVPVLKPLLPDVQPDLYGLLASVFHELLVGLLIGSCLQLLMLAAQTAGAFLDLNIGLGSVQLLNPMTNAPTSLLARFKFMLALVLLLVMNGHHLMFEAFVRSYSLTPLIGAESMPAVREGLLTLLGKLSLLSLQIAAPPAAVCIVIDATAGVVNKSVPQMQVFLVSLPAKILMGIMALSLSLPILAYGVQSGVEHTFDALAGMMGGR